MFAAPFISVERERNGTDHLPCARPPAHTWRYGTDRVIGPDPRHGVGWAPCRHSSTRNSTGSTMARPPNQIKDACVMGRVAVHRLPLLSSPPYVQSDRSMPHAPCRPVQSLPVVVYLLHCSSLFSHFSNEGFVRNDGLSAAKTTTTTTPTHGVRTCTVHLYVYASNVSFICKYSQLDRPLTCSPKHECLFFATATQDFTCACDFILFYLCSLQFVNGKKEMQKGYIVYICRI
jgi:hypothetical protein